MILFKKIPLIILLGIFLLSLGASASEKNKALSLLNKAKEEIYKLNFERAYGLLSQINKKHPEFSKREKVIILKNIISLGQTFSNLRLYSAYHQGRGFYKEDKEKDPLSPQNRLNSYRAEYLKRTKKWAKRLKKDIKGTLKISQEIELSIKYPGVEELPFFVKTGIDTRDNITKGIPPTPSQARNIEESEEYAGVLSVIYLSAQKDLNVPQRKVLIKEKITPKMLVYYSNLWINNVLILTGTGKETFM